MYRGGRSRQSLGTLLHNNTAQNNSLSASATVSSATLTFPISSYTKTCVSTSDNTDNTPLHGSSAGLSSATPPFFHSNPRRTPSNLFQCSTAPSHFSSNSCGRTTNTSATAGYFQSAANVNGRNIPLKSDYVQGSSKGPNSFPKCVGLSSKAVPSSKSSSISSKGAGISSKSYNSKNSNSTFAHSNKCLKIIDKAVRRFHGESQESDNGSSRTPAFSTPAAPRSSSCFANRSSDTQVACDMCESGYDTERTITVCKCGFSWKKTIHVSEGGGGGEDCDDSEGGGVSPLRTFSPSGLEGSRLAPCTSPGLYLRQPCRQQDSNPGLPARKPIRSPVDQAGDVRFNPHTS
ncbi:hypothetical protein FHG87_012047 [Trinorchestia longiramus]|nr:hypothetical protein FHG87_012047 [Trinorchestia longiramus]